MVVLAHATFYVQDRLIPSMGVWHYGETGVDIFFVISGFVMVVSTERKAGQPNEWWIFGLNRIIRIVPMYWLATLVKVATMLTLPAAALHASLSGRTLFKSLFFVPQFNSEGDFRPLLGVGWTLVYEMFFYALFTLGLAVAGRYAFWFVAVILAIFGTLGILQTSTHWPAWQAYFSPIVFFFLSGMVIAKLRLLRGSTAVLLSLGIMSAIAASIVTLHVRQFDLSSRSWQRILIASCVIAFAVAGERRFGPLVPKWLLYLGGASYSLYLFHPLIGPIAPALLDHLGVHWALLSVIGTFSAALVGALIVYQWIEKPVTRYLRSRMPTVARRRSNAAESHPVQP